MLNIYYQVPISVLTPLKVKIKQCQLNKEYKGRATQFKFCRAR